MDREEFRFIVTKPMKQERKSDHLSNAIVNQAGNVNKQGLKESSYNIRTQRLETGTKGGSLTCPLLTISQCRRSPWGNSLVVAQP